MDTKKQTPHINVDYFENLTGELKNGETDDVDEVGKRIKKLRESKGLSGLVLIS